MKPDNDKQSYTVSVVIPAYNVEKYIGRAIDSVLAQTRRPDEIIVVDDGSTDKTAEVIKSYGPKVHCIHQENGGASVARNTGIEAARSEWIAFLDADDEWLPEKLAEQIELHRNNSDLVWSATNYEIHPMDGMPPKLTFEPERFGFLCSGAERLESYFDAVETGLSLSTITIMVRKSVIIDVGMFRVGQWWAQDTDLFFRIAYKWPQIGYLQNALSINHFGRPESITQTNKLRIEQRCDLIERHLKMAAECGMGESFRPCALKLLTRWLRGYVDLPNVDISQILDRFGDILPRNLKIEMRLRIASPRLAGSFFGMYSRLKRSLIWHRQKIRPGTLLRLQALRKRLLTEIKSGSTILDVGSYDGTIADHLRKNVPCLDATVVDVDEAGLKVASSKGLKICKASALEMPFEDGSIDVVLCLDVIEHVDDDRGVIREMSRVLKCGGKLILTTPCANGVIFPFMSTQENEKVNRKWGHVRVGYSIEGLEALLEEVGLKIEKRSGYFNVFTRFAYWLRYLSGWRVPGRDAFYRMIVRLERCVRLKTHEHYLVCRKMETAAGKGQDAASEGDSEQCQ